MLGNVLAWRMLLGERQHILLTENASHAYHGATMCVMHTKPWISRVGGHHSWVHEQQGVQAVLR